MNAKVIGTGWQLPAYEADNHYLATLVETSDEWIRERTGIVKRHLAKEETTTSLAAGAARKALADAGLQAEELDLLMVATITPDTDTPSTACRVQAELGGTDEPTAFRLALAELAERLTAWEGPPAVKNVLALHASARATSNTLALWELVKAGLGPDIAVQEVCLQNGTLADCIGCSYTACLHFGQGGGCFYGGPMVDEVFPAVKDCDALVMLCANYNDALAANLTAFVNRLTALFRQSRFYEKRLYGLIVSGYSGGDLLARQLISGLNMNKSFYLPPRFCLLETANEKGSLVKLPGIARRGAAFAAHIVE